MTTNSTTNSSNLSLKLLIDSKNKKVVFAEASKDVVDFLFTLLQLPLATVIKLLTKEAVVGCLGNLYSSVENLNHVYWQPNLSKDVILNPTILTSSPAISGLLPSAAINHSQIIPKLYRCSSPFTYCSSSTVTDVYNSKCAACNRAHVNHIRQLGITMLNQFNVKDVGVLKETVVQLGMKEGLKLLKASIESEMVLTTVFLA
ncbi:uncharacterized protein LOC130950302 [Arachis stenosperma]|uniref:uncharacterized protein LOC130950302 n=1 Tax=Arachis stenosperma TaxID=217475 RepID=UPI0025AC02C8|nr:uncharacterized protein LOC130950302 [Arachis stenosperma]